MWKERESLYKCNRVLTMSAETLPAAALQPVTTSSAAGGDFKWGDTQPHVELAIVPVRWEVKEPAGLLAEFRTALLELKEDIVVLPPHERLQYVDEQVAKAQAVKVTVTSHGMKDAMWNIVWRMDGEKVRGYPWRWDPVESIGWKFFGSRLMGMGTEFMQRLDDPMSNHWQIFRFIGLTLWRRKQWSHAHRPPVTETSDWGDVEACLRLAKPQPELAGRTPAGLAAKGQPGLATHPQRMQSLQR